MCHSILILLSNSENDPNIHDTLMPLCIKNTLQCNYSRITPTVLDLLTWDLVPRWTIRVPAGKFEMIITVPDHEGATMYTLEIAFVIKYVLNTTM